MNKKLKAVGSSLVAGIISLFCFSLIADGPPAPPGMDDDTGGTGHGGSHANVSVPDPGTGGGSSTNGAGFAPTFPDYSSRSNFFLLPPVFLSSNSILLTVTNQTTNVAFDLFGTTNLNPLADGLNLTNWVWLARGAIGQTNFILTNLWPNEGYFIAATLLDSDGDFLTDAFESLVSHTDSRNPDTDGDGVPDGAEVWNGGDPRDSSNIAPVLLGYWRFDTTNWLGDRGQIPILATNLQLVSSWRTNGVEINTNTSAKLLYRASETNGWANILCPAGSVLFWFKPDWETTNSAPSEGRLIEIGSPGGTNDWWSLLIRSNGALLSFCTGSNGVFVTNVSATIHWNSNEWYQVGLSYSASNTSLYLDGVPVVTNGSGVTLWPRASVRAQGFAFGTGLGGTNLILGELDEFQTFSYPLNAAAMAYFADQDQDGLPDGWEIRYFGTLDQSGNDDTDGDGKSNWQEYDARTDPSDYYNGMLPVLTLNSGDDQIGLTNTWLTNALTVLVTNVDGAILTNAPVDFLVYSGDALVGLATNSTPSDWIEARTDSNGVARIWCRLGTNEINGISALAFAATNITEVEFVESSDFYNGVPPHLSITGGNGQTNLGASYFSSPLTVLVTNNAGTLLTNAPIKFTLTQGHGLLTSDTNSDHSLTCSVRTDTNGVASILAWSTNLTETNLVAAIARTAGTNVTVMFNEYSVVTNTVQMNYIGGDGQYGCFSNYLDRPLVISLSDANHLPLTNTLVSFTVTDGTAQISTNSGGWLTNSLAVYTDATGMAQIYAYPSSSFSIVTAECAGTGVTNYFFGEYATDCNTPAGIQLNLTNTHVMTTNLTVSVIGGSPTNIAFLINNTNFDSATWISPTNSYNLMLGATNGIYNVWLGFVTNGVTNWTETLVTVDTVPPDLNVTSPTNGSTVTGSFVEIMGFSSEPLSAVICVATNSLGASQNVFSHVHKQFFDTNANIFTTNWFQCYDVLLTPGTNRMTLTLVDLAGNVTQSNLSYIFSTNGDTTAPVMAVISPVSGTTLAGSSFTLTGTLDDATASIRVSGLGSSSIQGQVTRDGRFWVEDLPLSGLTNTLTITATDAAGNQRSTNLTLYQSDLQITVDPVDGLTVGPTNVPVVTGTITGTNTDILVNGIRASVTDGFWEADNVPVSGDGTASFQVVVGDPVVFTENRDLPPMARLAWFTEKTGGSGLHSDGRCDFLVTTRENAIWSRGSGGSYYFFQQNDYYACVGDPARTEICSTSIPLSTNDWSEPYSSPGGCQNLTYVAMLSGKGRSPGTSPIILDSQTDLRTGSKGIPGQGPYSFVLEVQAWGFNSQPIPPSGIRVDGQSLLPKASDQSTGIAIVQALCDTSYNVTPQVNSPFYFYGVTAVQLTNSLVPDYDHNGVIDAGDSKFQTHPFRFWINDDKDTGDVSAGDSDIPGAVDGNALDSKVNGRSDVIDFFPVWAALRTLLDEFPTSGGFEYRLTQADSAVNVVYTDLTRDEAFDYLTNVDRRIYGSDFRQPVYSADVVPVTAAGTVLSRAFLDRITADENKGVLLVEGRTATTKPLTLEVWYQDRKLYSKEMPLSLSEVEGMYRWANLRQSIPVDGEATPGIDRASDLAEPPNSPDAESNGKQFVFVHGYNVAERESRAYIAEMFKRLYQSGSRAMFTGISWYGNESQLPVGGGVTPDYHVNIRNAFLTAPILSNVVATLPGVENYISGHSMGNVVVSAAMKDHGMAVNGFFAIDAAVAMEVYDGSLREEKMISPVPLETYSWTNYDERLWASEWYQLFSPAKGYTNDGRYTLTWRDRFAGIPNVYNFYSSGEEVLQNSNGNLPLLPPFNTDPPPVRAWVNQEMRKATPLMCVLTLHCQGGWAPNPFWEIPDGAHGKTTLLQMQTPSAANSLTDAQLRTNSFFKSFRDSRLYDSSLGSDSAKEPIVNGEVLGAGVPSLSFAQGANSTTVFNGPDGAHSFDMDTLYKTGWPGVRVDGPYQKRWLHSDLKNIAYPFNHKFYEKIVETGELK